MKRFLLFSLIITPLLVNAQECFFGKHVELYKDCLLTIKQGVSSYNHNFLKPNTTNTDLLELIKNPYRHNLKKEEYELIGGNSYKCIDVISTDDIIYKNRHLLKFYNDKLGYFYFLYDEDREYDFKFESASKIEIPKGYFCKDIKFEEDKFTRKKTFKTPILDDVTFYKIYENGKLTYYMSATRIGSIPDTGKGVIILFKDGSKIIKKEVETDVRVNYDADFEHSAYFKLNELEVKKIASEEMTDIRIYIYDLTVKMPFKYKEYMKCLIEK